MTENHIDRHQRLRVAFIAPYPAGSVLPESEIRPRYRGREHAAPWVRALSNAMSRRHDIDLHLFAHTRSVTKVHHVNSHGVNITFIPKWEPYRTDPYHRHWPGTFSIYRAVQKFQPDMVHGFGTEGACGIIAARLPWPNVVFIQGIIEEYAPYHRFSPLQSALLHDLERITARRTGGLIAETTFARDWALRVNPKAMVKIIPHGSNEEFFRGQPTFTENNIVIIGTLFHRKGVDVAIKAISLCKDKTATLTVVGQGSDRDKLGQLAIDLGVADRVRFTGGLGPMDVIGQMEKARAMVIAARVDTSPNVVTEAHACGLPVVGTRGGGIPDMIDDGVDGYLVAVDDSVAMAEKLDILLAEPERARRMGLAGREKVKVLNDPDRVAQEHVDFYHDVIRRRNLLKLRRRQAIRSVAQFSVIRKAASVVPLTWRMGSKYWEWRDFLLNAQQWSKEQINDWQLNRLKEMVKFAYDHTRGYRDLYTRAGIKPEDIRTTEDFQRLPFVTKNMLRDNLELFSSRSGHRRYCSTGGSTGIPMGFYHGNTARHIENAFMHSCWSWVGWQLGTPSIILRGGYIGSAKKIAKYDPYFRELRLSSYFLTGQTLPRYIEQINRHQMKVIQAYPSSLNLLCDLLKKAGQTNAIKLDLILLGSENIYDWQMSKFREIFPGATIFGWYGQAEQVILAPWCERSNRYHARPFYSYTELLNTQNEKVADGEEGELVGTNFHNFHTPFIRYRTMDRAVRGGSFCPDCGRQFMVMDCIKGRSHEVLVTAGGRFISMTAINMHDDIFEGIRQFQFYQEQVGHVTFRYVPNAPLGREAEERIRHGLEAKLGGDMMLTITAVDEVPRTHSGKFRFLDQRLSIQYGDRP